MFDKDSKGISYTAGFFMLIAFTIAGVIIASFISIYVWQAMTGISALKMEEALSDPANSDAIKVMQCITLVIGFLLPAMVTAMMLSRKPLKLTGFSYRINLKQAALVCCIMIAALFVATFLAYISKHIPISESLKLRFDKKESDYLRQAVAIIQMNNFGEYLLSLFIMAFIPALCEEVLFRGGLQNYLTRAAHMPWLSIIIVSIIFSVAHNSFYGFLPRLFLGIILGLLFEYSGRIWLCIIAHFLNNAFIVTMAYIEKLRGHSITETVSKGEESWMGIFALPIVIALLIYFKKIGNKPVEIPDGVLRNEELRNTPFY